MIFSHSERKRNEHTFHLEEYTAFPHSFPGSSLEASITKKLCGVVMLVPCLRWSLEDWDISLATLSEAA